MDDHQKEQVLHKVVAASAFLFALCILPVAQYYLVTSQVQEGSAQVSGQVAGSSTAASPAAQQSVRGNIANPLDAEETAAPVEVGVECESTRNLELQQLDSWYAGKKNALWREYEKATASYQEAIPRLKGTPESIQTEKAALEGLIDAEYQPYLKKLSAVEAAVESQKKSIQSRVCPAG